MKKLKKQNSTFIKGDFCTCQIGGPKDWKANGGKPNWRLNKNMSYYLGPKSLKFMGIPSNEGIKVTMKSGFITDGGSYTNMLVPSIGSQTGKYFRAYALHDILARTSFVTFKQSNIILDEALELLGMSWFDRQKVYWPLQIGGSALNDLVLLDNAKQHIKFDRYEIIT